MWLLPILLAVGYLLGSIPSGFLIVKLTAGKDIREVGSGRTGGTNVMRAAGFGAGLLTAVSDILKGTLSVLIAQWVLPPDLKPIGMVLGGLGAILGHNYSIFLKFKGGAGGAPAVGGAIGLWWPSVFIAVPIGAFVLFGIGYASLATLVAALTITAIFVYRYLSLGAAASPPEFILYGVGAFILLAWALRPNIKRLIRGEERVVGWRAKRMQQKQAAANAGGEGDRNSAS